MVTDNQCWSDLTIDTVIPLVSLKRDLVECQGKLTVPSGLSQTFSLFSSLIGCVPSAASKKYKNILLILSIPGNTMGKKKIVKSVVNHHVKEYSSPSVKKLKCNC